MSRPIQRRIRAGATCTTPHSCSGLPKEASSSRWPPYLMDTVPRAGSSVRARSDADGSADSGSSGTRCAAGVAVSSQTSATPSTARVGSAASPNMPGESSKQHTNCRHQLGAAMSSTRATCGTPTQWWPGFFYAAGSTPMTSGPLPAVALRAGRLASRLRAGSCETEGIACSLAVDQSARHVVTPSSPGPPNTSPARHAVPAGGRPPPETLARSTDRPPVPDRSSPSAATVVQTDAPALRGTAWHGQRQSEPCSGVARVWHASAPDDEPTASAGR